MRDIDCQKPQYSAATEKGTNGTERPKGPSSPESRISLLMYTYEQIQIKPPNISIEMIASREAQIEETWRKKPTSITLRTRGI